MIPEAGPSWRRQRKLTGEIGKGLERRPHPLVHLGARLGGQTGALVDCGQDGIRVELARAQPLGGLLQPLRQLSEGVSHGVQTTADAAAAAQ